MSDDLLTELEKFLADGGESKDLPKALTIDDMRALYGDKCMDDFERQFFEHLKREQDS